MARKKSLIDLEDDDLVLDRKAKRKLARSLEKKQQEKLKEESQEEKKNSGAVPSDAMSRLAMLCQEARWRDALKLCRSVLNQASEDTGDDVACGVMMAMEKVERSLRRQMASAVIVAANDVLQKEYLLNVGK